MQVAYLSIITLSAPGYVFNNLQIQIMNVEGLITGREHIELLMALNETAFNTKQV